MTVHIAPDLIEGLAQQMVDAHLITKDQLAIAKVSRDNLGDDLGKVLVDKGFISEPQLLSFLAQSLSIPFKNLSSEKIDPVIVKKISYNIAKRYHALPLSEKEDVFVVAMADPFDLFALDDIRSSLKAEVRPVLALADEIDELIERHFGRSDKEMEVTEALEEMELMAGDQEEITKKTLEEIATGSKIVQTVSQMLVQASREKASDIHLEPFRYGIRIRFRLDGMLEEKNILPKELHLPVVSRIKIMAGLDIAERRVPQDGRARIRLGATPLDLRIATCPTMHGEKVVIRLLSKEAVSGIESIGFSEKDRKKFAEILNHSHGIFLVTGPTGSGKSTTLYAALKRLNSPERNIISVEDPVESEIDGITQAQVNLKAGVTFASLLRSILRQDPDVIMLGEIRDSETAQIAVRAAITGHLVLSTLHTNTAAGAISRLNDLGVEPFMISSSLVGILAQRLVRRICSHCRREISLDKMELGPYKELIRKAFQGRGCSKCRLTGYSGRMGIFELASISEKVRQVIAEGKSDHEIEKAFREEGVLSMMQEGFSKVNKGQTTIEEILRVISED